MEKAPENLYIVIPVGGTGTRLWPRSRQAIPKQFINFFGKRTVIQEAILRLNDFIPRERIFVIAHDRYKQIFLGQVPGFLPQNYISEPEKRGTSAAFALSAMRIRSQNPQGIIHWLVCDDYIQDIPRFRRMMKVAAEVADREKAMVVYGVRSTYPATGLGYIQTNGLLEKEEEISIFKVKGFVEKPDEATAKKFLAAGNYYWHGSGFTAPLVTVFDEMKRKWPVGFGLVEKIDQLSKLPADLEEGKIAQIYHQFEDSPIEYSILEKADRTFMAMMEDSWRDIGSWQVIYDVSPKDQDGNVVMKYGQKGEFIGLEAKNNLIEFNDQLVAVAGVEGLIIIAMDDAILICKKDKAQDVKKLVELLKTQGKTSYL